MGVSVRDVGLGVLLAALLLQAYNYSAERGRRALVSRVTQPGDDDIKTRSQPDLVMFKEKRVYQVTPKIFVAGGFALANSIMIVGEGGVVVVDVTESVQAGREVLMAFRNVTKKPIKGIIYTHSHADHVQGASAFIEDPAHPPEIWAHHTLVTQMQRQWYTNAAVLKRAFRQFGVMLGAINDAGIGPLLNIDPENMEQGFKFPTKMMTGIEKDIQIAGLKLKLVHIPGETDDQIGVWVEEDKAFLCADDIYKAFPNLYAIRGTPTRDLLHWAASLDRVMAFMPEVIVPAHTLPVHGQDNIRELLTGYRDAIQFVHDQTVRYMNRGLLPGEIAALVRLPEHLAGHPYLQEFYGTVAWSVKGVFNAYMGWFSGDPVDLEPLTPTEMARRMVKLAGGVEAALEAARGALEAGDMQWALVLSSHVIRVDPDHIAAKEVKAKSLMGLGRRQTSMNGKNYFLTTAMEELGEVEISITKKTRANAVRTMPMIALFRTFQVRWNVESCGVVNTTVHFHFTDTLEDITMTTRNGIVLISDRQPITQANITVTVSSAAWRESLVDKVSGLASLATGEMMVEGGFPRLLALLSCFDRE